MLFLECNATELPVVELFSLLRLLFPSSSFSSLICLLQVHWRGQGSLSVLEFSDGTLFFFLLFVYTVTSIALCFLISVFFSKGLFISHNRKNRLFFVPSTLTQSRTTFHKTNHHVILSYLYLYLYLSIYLSLYIYISLSLDWFTIRLLSFQLVWIREQISRQLAHITKLITNHRQPITHQFAAFIYRS